MAGAPPCACPKPRPPQVTARLLAEQSVDDLTVEDPPIEDVIEQVFVKPAESAMQEDVARDALSRLLPGTMDRHPDTSSSTGLANYF